MQFEIYRYNPEQDKRPYMQHFELDTDKYQCNMLLDALITLKDNHDSSLTFRRSCREGVCGSDGMNVNGKNHLACITKLSSLKSPVVIRPLPGLPVVRDLVVDMQQFYDQYAKVKPYLQNSEPPVSGENLQSPADHALLDGLYDCIMCACCSTACPSYWWNPDKYLGPAALLWAYRFLVDSRDTAKAERLADLADPFSVYRCRGVMSCVDTCPKGLNPLRAINHIKDLLVKESV